tara:strand:- start:1288 stop:1827 length:540 start_codon:yes stop_codon:yes gene_type:complete
MNQESDIIKYVYSKYRREYELCQTNGYFSLNLSKGSIVKIKRLLNIQKNDTIGWVGFGDARELLCLALMYPQNTFTGYEINKDAYNIACMVKSQLGISNVILYFENVLDTLQTFSTIYSTAISGPRVYQHMYKLSLTRCCMLQNMWSYIDDIDIENKNSLKEKVFLAGSREQRMLVAYW